MATKEVSIDPSVLPFDNIYTACGQNSKKRPVTSVALNQSQLSKRASVDTAPYVNPFLQKEPGFMKLCTDCTSKKHGWAVIADPRHYGSRSRSALKAWKRRICPARRGKPYPCYICKRISAFVWSENDRTKSVYNRNHSLNLNLFKVLLFCQDAQEVFCEDLSRRTGMQQSDSRFLLHSIPEARFCSVHHNHTRHSIDECSKFEPSLKGSPGGVCIFNGKGCPTQSSGLRPLPRIKIRTLEQLEETNEYDFVVRSHSGDVLTISDVAGKQACRHCRYIITRGTQGEPPSLDSSFLDHPTDRCLVDCVLFALDLVVNESCFMRCPDVLRHVQILREKVVTPLSTMKRSRFLPASAVFDLRRSLTQRSSDGDVCSKTVHSRISPVLASKNVHLYSLTRKFRCYAIMDSVNSTLHCYLSLSSEDELKCSPRVRRRLLMDLGNRFFRKKQDYIAGNWRLSEEIAEVPLQLWSSLILEMASPRQLESWKVVAVAQKQPITTVFPVCNSPNILPSEELDMINGTAAKEYAIPRSDLVLCIRTLKVIEQIVFSRSRLAVGPLTTSLSLGGMLECSASWTSVLSSLGLVTSYDSINSFCKKVKDDTEQHEHGAFKDVNLEQRIVNVQIDNFDMHPYHSVIAGGKRLPMINETVTQSIVQTRKRLKRTVSGTPANSSQLQCAADGNQWLEPGTQLTSREAFVSSQCSEDIECILNEFNDLAFGVLYKNRDHVLDTSERSTTYKRGSSVKAYKHQRRDFRTLLLSCFKPHGEVDPNKRFLYDQDVVSVDISRLSAADTLTIYQKVKLIEDLLSPGRVGCPSFVFVCGDQPTYKMLVTLWRNSYMEVNRSVQTEERPKAKRMHEWLIPFPGMFHIEKQSLFPPCKELLYGMGLEESASCSGLSRSQIAKILNHSHSRNNHSLLFSICASMIIHISDMVLAEFPDVLEEIQRHESNTDSLTTSRSKKRSKLFSCISNSVNQGTTEIGSVLRRKVVELFAHGPNGKHLVQTVLFTCLLPTVGFHVLSRTGHTDVVDSFWLRLNNLLHTSAHLRYQELYLFYMFFKSIMPRMTLNDLYMEKPGAMVARVPCFTSGKGSIYDSRGWVYVHLDEALEMLIVRMVKSLNVVMLPYIESANAWLLILSRAKMVIRGVTGAASSYFHRCGEETEGRMLLTREYERNFVQSSTVRSMVELMRQKWFLSYEHRSAERLRNVFRDGGEDLDDDEAQKPILNMERLWKEERGTPRFCFNARMVWTFER